MDSVAIVASFWWWRIGIVAPILTLPHLFLHFKMIRYMYGFSKDQKDADKIDALIRSSVLAKKPESSDEWVFFFWNVLATFCWILFFILTIFRSIEALA